MRTGMSAVALAGAAVLATGPGAASPAAASTQTWTVRPGGAITATAGKTTLTDTSTGNTLSCTASGMSGTVKSGRGLSGTGIGSITAADYTCPTPVFSFRLTPRGLPWHLNLTSYNPRTGVIRGTISHLQLTFAAPDCSAVINGTSSTAPDGVVAVAYTGKTSKLTMLRARGDLHWYHIHGCARLVSNGDPAALSAAYAISPPQTITSP